MRRSANKLFAQMRYTRSNPQIITVDRWKREKKQRKTSSRLNGEFTKQLARRASATPQVPPCTSDRRRRPISKFRDHSPAENLRGGGAGG